MKGLRAFLCRHPLLAVLLPFLPCIGIAVALVLMKIIDPSFALILLVWAFFFISFPIRRIPHTVMREAAIALERDLDPDTYLESLDLLRARRLKNPLATISLGANYAAGLDAKGKSEEALAYLRSLLKQRGALDPANGVQFDLSYAVVAVHTDAGRADIPALLERICATVPTLPPALAAAVRETAESVRMAYALYTGTEDSAALISYYTRVIGRYRAEGEMSRRRLVRACMNLARVYDRAGRVSDAGAMYRYVAENGGGLGIAKEAREALSSLASRQKEAPVAEKSEENPL